MAAAKPSRGSLLGLRGWIILLSILLAAVPAVIMLPAVVRLSSDVTRRAANDTVGATGRFVAARLSHVLYNEWQKHERLAEQFQRTGDAAELRTRLDGLRALNEQYVWLGFAMPDGRVAAASGGLLEGQNVSARPWFTAGLQGPFAGDVHGALMLQRLISPNAREPLRLVDFALPLRRTDGSIAGVLGSHLSWEWVRSLVREVPLSENIEVMLVSNEGQVLIGPEGLEGTSPNLPSLMAARQSVAAQRVETWPDGQSYLTTVLPEASYRNLPSFGWSIVARQREDAAFAAARTMTSGLLTSIGLTALAILLIGILAALFLRAPLARVAASAAALGEGRFDHPVPDERRYSEVAALSGSLAELHSRLTEQAERAEAVAPKLTVVSGRS